MKLDWPAFKPTRHYCYSMSFLLILFTLSERHVFNVRIACLQEVNEQVQRSGHRHTAGLQLVLNKKHSRSKKVNIWFSGRRGGHFQGLMFWLSNNTLFTVWATSSNQINYISLYLPHKVSFWTSNCESIYHARRSWEGKVHF